MQAGRAKNVKTAIFLKVKILVRNAYINAITYAIIKTNRIDKNNPIKTPLIINCLFVGLSHFRKYRTEKRQARYSNTIRFWQVFPTEKKAIIIKTGNKPYFH
jgi:hypothetical protein